MTKGWDAGLAVVEPLSLKAQCVFTLEEKSGRLNERLFTILTEKCAKPLKDSLVLAMTLKRKIGDNQHRMKQANRIFYVWNVTVAE